MFGRSIKYLNEIISNIEFFFNTITYKMTFYFKIYKIIFKNVSSDTKIIGSNGSIKTDQSHLTLELIFLCIHGCVSYM